MKQLKLFLPIILFLFLSRLFSSCCVDKGITSENGFYFDFSDDSRITKIELIGTNRFIDYSDGSFDRMVTLNPADTISRYRIFYENSQLASDTGSGIVTISYTREAEYQSSDCGDNIVIDYNPVISHTTFTRAYFYHSIISTSYVQITR